MKKSAGLLLYRKNDGEMEVFLVHPGGPFWKGKEKGAWTIPKGEFDDLESPLAAAQREFKEETGHEVSGAFIELVPVKQKSGKMVYAWGVEANIDAEKIKSNEFKIEWPAKSGKWLSFPEVDKAAWFGTTKAKEMINPAQVALLDDLREKLHR